MSETEGKERILYECRNLASGTIGQLVGQTRYDEIEKAQSDFVQFADKNFDTNWESWQDAWEAYSQATSSDFELALDDWENQFPTTPGKYWFYGEPWKGSMGIDFKTKHKSQPELYLVEVKVIGGNQLLAITKGQIMPKRPFDKSVIGTGYLGYFAKANLPQPPADADKLFE